MPSPSTMIRGFSVNVCIWLKSTITCRAAARRSRASRRVSVVSGIGAVSLCQTNESSRGCSAAGARDRQLDLSDQRAVASAPDARGRSLPCAPAEAGAAMTAPVVRMSVLTVAARPDPRPKGLGRPVGTPLTALAGFVDPRGASTAGLAPARSWLVVVELEDEDGVTGVGTAGFGNPAAVELLHQLEPLVTGCAPSEVGRLWETMYRATLNIGRRGVVLHAISSVDIALWDLFGKQLGVPVYELLGGKLRPSMPAYASWLYATDDLDALAAEAAGWAADGFGAVKQRLPNGPLEGKHGIRRNVDLVRTVVDAVGPDVDVM